MRRNNPDRSLHQKVDNLTNLLEGLRLEVREVREEQRVERLERAREQQELVRLRQQLRERRAPPVVATRIDEPIPTVRATRVRTPVAQRAPNRNTFENRPGPEFQTGDTIRVTNRYRGQQGRIAVVTRTFGNKVYFSIDGAPTYRWAHNVERVNPEELNSSD